MYALEFSKGGAQVCAIEGREANLAKAEFAAQALSLPNIEFHRDDVRNLSKSRYGRFDVVLCLGILYHVDAPEVFEFLKSIYEVCDHAAVIDTHVALTPRLSVDYKGNTYYGKSFREHADDASGDDKERKLGASLDNLHSFEFTRPSLYNVLADIGFTSVYECQVPQEPDKPESRATFVAIKGMARTPVLTPQLPEDYLRRLPEETASAASAVPSGLRRFIRRAIPNPFKRIARSLLGSK